MYMTGGEGSVAREPLHTCVSMYGGVRAMWAKESVVWRHEDSGLRRSYVYERTLVPGSWDRGGLRPCLGPCLISDYYGFRGYEQVINRGIRS